MTGAPKLGASGVARIQRDERYGLQKKGLRHQGVEVTLNRPTKRLVKFKTACRQNGLALQKASHPDLYHVKHDWVENTGPKTRPDEGKR